MRETGINMEKVKRNNRSSILRLLNRQGPMPRKDIAGALKLTPAAVTMLCNELIEEEILSNNGEFVEENRSGRKKVLIDINYKKRYVLAISILPENTYLYISDLRGKSIDKIRMKTDKKMEPGKFLILVAEKGKQLLDKNSISAKDILGTGIVITGIVDKVLGVSRQAYGIWNRSVPVKEILEAEFHLPVIIDNNVKAFASAELLYGSGKENDNILFVKWGPGVGSAIVIQNMLYDGSENRAAELGHYIVDTRGERCQCGRSGCLETKISYGAILKKIKGVFSKEEIPMLFDLVNGNIAILEEELISNENIGFITDIKDKPVIDIVNDCILDLAHTLVNTITILDPGQVIIFCPLFENESKWNYFLECCLRFNGELGKDLLKLSELGRKINFIGPAAIAANQFFFGTGGKQIKKI